MESKFYGMSLIDMLWPELRDRPIPLRLSHSAFALFTKTNRVTVYPSGRVEIEPRDE